MPEIRVRVTKELLKQIKEWKNRLGYGSMADFMREATRDFIQRKRFLRRHGKYIEE